MFDETSVKKQQCFIVDPSGFIKLVLYGKHTDTVEEGKVYQFKKVRVKATKNGRYVNTPKNENECVISATQSFSEALPIVENTASPIIEHCFSYYIVENTASPICSPSDKYSLLF